MRRPAFLALALLCGCGGAQKEIESLQQQNVKFAHELMAKQKEVEDLKGKRAELEGLIADHEEKLSSSQSRIEELSKSNKDLGDSMKAGQGELSGRLKQLVAEKDELSRKLNDAMKDKIAADRSKANLIMRREKLTAELAALRQERDDLAQKLTELDSSEKARQEERSARLQKIRDDFGTIADAALRLIQAEKASIAQNGEAIELTLQDTALFEGQGAKLSEEGAAALDKIARALQSIPVKAVRVQGHSDNAPLKSGISGLLGGFSSHWDLSAARAVAVTRALADRGVEAKVLSAEGFGDGRPVKPNDSAESRAANRRIVLAVEIGR